MPCVVLVVWLVIFLECLTLSCSNFLKQLQVAMARVGIDLGIFDALKDTQQSISLDTLAEKSGSSPKLLGMRKALILSSHELLIFRSYLEVLGIAGDGSGNKQESLHFK